MIPESWGLRDTDATQSLQCGNVREWDGPGRAPTLPSSPTGKGHLKAKELAMSRKLDSAITVIGIDIGKNAFHIVAMRKRSPKQCRARR